MTSTMQRPGEGPAPVERSRPVAVGLDGSPVADEALAWAGREARRREAPLLVVTAVGLGRAPSGVTVSGPMASSRALEAARRLAGARVDRARGQGSLPEDLDVAVEVHLARAGAALLEISERAQLVVVGHRGRGPVASALMGSVAFSVSARAACPVVVVRGDAHRSPSPQHPVVVGLDVGAGREEGNDEDGADDDGADDDASAPALELAAATAHRSGAPLMILAAVQPGEPLAGDLSQSFPEDMIARERSHAGSAIDAARAAALRGRPGLEVRATVVVDHPADALTEASSDAGLVVVGARGRGAVSGLFLGSVSHEVIHRAACPVVVAREPRS